MPSLQNEIAKAIDEVYESLEPVSIIDFFETGFELTKDDRFQIFRLEFSPWIRALCHWWDDPLTPWIYLVQGSQTAKTTFMMGVLLYVSRYVSGAVPALWVQSTEEEASLFVSERLRQFLEDAGSAIQNWKKAAFRVGNCPLKVGFATTKNALRSKPARFLFGDETALWKELVSYVKKRARTYIGRQKGIFGSTPPDNPDHHSWASAIEGNFYQWWVECPICQHKQPLLLRNLKWKGKREDGSWDYSEVKKTAHYAVSYTHLTLPTIYSV